MGETELFRLARDSMTTLGPGGTLGLAVSGGSDSMAMLHLMADAAPKGWRFEVVTVDHRLRTEAAEEAAFVAEVCAELGVAHATLAWTDHPRTGNLMEAAARARYGLMADWARQRGISHVAVAHTADDQAETFLMGLSRQAGLEGLAGMRAEWTEGGVAFLRPLLAASREGLRAFLRRRGHGWRDDPSNDDPRYARVRARQALAGLRPAGITVDGLAATIGHLSAALSVVGEAVAEAFRRTGREEGGALAFSRDGFLALHPEISRRLLVAAFRWLSGAEHPPRAEAVERVAQAIRAGRDATLFGCRVRVSGPTLRIVREPRVVATVSAATEAPWDGRWLLDGPHAAGLEIRALGAEGLRLCADWRAVGLPRDTLLVTPAVWRGEALIAAPLAGFGTGWTARLQPDFASFLLAH